MALALLSPAIVLEELVTIQTGPRPDVTSGNVARIFMVSKHA